MDSRTTIGNNRRVLPFFCPWTAAAEHRPDEVTWTAATFCLYTQRRRDLSRKRVCLSMGRAFTTDETPCYERYVDSG